MHPAALSVQRQSTFRLLILLYLARLLILLLDAALLQLFIFYMQAINTVRVLAADIVQKSMSGHPGAPMGCAPMAHVLFTKVCAITPLYAPPSDGAMLYKDALHKTQALVQR